MVPGDTRVFVAGHAGMVGSAFVRKLKAAGFGNLVTRDRPALNLIDQREVQRFFRDARPEVVILAAARVGGIAANMSHQAEFIYENTLMSFNVIWASLETGVKKLLNLGSSCMYPRASAGPISETQLLLGPPEPTSEGYAVAKIAALELCKLCNRQFDTEFITLIPASLYGPNDNYDPNTAHVLPALIRRFHEAKLEALPSVTVWGSGTPRRELMHVDDLASAGLHVLEHTSVSDNGDVINVGVGEDIAIRDLAHLVADVAGYRGEVHFDSSRPDGVARKLLDSKRIRKLGWAPRVSLREGLEATYRQFAGGDLRVPQDTRGGQELT